MKSQGPRDIGNIFDELMNMNIGGMSSNLSIRPSGIDMYEEDDEVVYVVDLPGYESDDVEITVEQNTLVIVAEKEGHRRLDNKTRRLRIPKNVSAEESTATMENGVLSIRLPYNEDSEKTQISID